MRSAWSTGAVLAAGGVVLVLTGTWLDLDVTSTALLGTALGGALALVPPSRGGTGLSSLGAAALGVVVAWFGYLLRALVLPDSPGGVAAALAVVVLLCALPAGLLRERLPLWAALLGAGAFAGVYEASYAAAPAEMAGTSLSALTGTALVLGAGFLLGSVVGPASATRVAATPRHDDVAPVLAVTDPEVRS